MAQDMGRASPEGPARNASVTCQGTESRSVSTVAWRAELAGHAAELASRGFFVFPCRPGDKRPAIDRWEERASADPAHVRAAWTDRCPGYNIGLACGPSRLVVVDLDVHGSLPGDWRLPGIRDGLDVLAQLCEWAGQPWPQTRWSTTPSGGWHLWFRAPDRPELRNTAGLLGPMIDTRAAGGYIVVPPSVVDDRPYELLDDCDPAPLPAWLLRLLAPPAPSPWLLRPPATSTAPGRLPGLLRTVANAAEGQRNSTLHWAACRAAELPDPCGAGEQLVMAAVAAGLPEREARRTVASGLAGGSR
jgi:hypothetical protein